MVDYTRQIKNWRIPKEKETQLTYLPISINELSTRLAHCLKNMNITEIQQVCIPDDIWYATKESWSSVFLNRPNLGRKAYRELVDCLISWGLEPIFVEEDDDSMTGGLMR